MNLQGMQHKDQIPALYVVRALALIGVLFVHVASVPVSEISGRASNMFVLFNFMNIFNRFGTTTFICLSAFVLFYRYYDQPVNKKLLISFYRRRLLYIGTPYLIFSVFYYGINMYYSYGESWQQVIQAASLVDFVQKLAVGKAFYHLYFVFINLQFYLLFPLMLLILQFKPKLSKHLVWIGLLLQWSFIIYNNYSLGYADKAQLAITYCSHYFLGAYLGIHYAKIIDWIVIGSRKRSVWHVMLWMVWIASSLADVYMYDQARLNGTIYNPLLYDLVWNCQTFTAALVLLQLAHFMYRKLNRRLVNILMHLGSLSFGIYMIHPVILFYYYRMHASHEPLHYYLYIAGAYSTTLALSWIIVGVVQTKVRIAWIFFGTSAKIRSDVRQKKAKAMHPANLPVSE